MKRVIMMIIMLMMVLPTYATTMCAADDTVAVVLDPSLSKSYGGANYATGEWMAWDAQSKFYGISACLNRSQGVKVDGLTDTDNNGNTNLVVGSERYGRYCWCRLIHPITSFWVKHEDSGSASNCVDRCGDVCGGRWGGGVSSLISSIAQ